MRKVFPVAIFCFCISISCKEIKKKLLPSFNVKIPDINLNIPPVRFVLQEEVPVGALRTHINLDSTIGAHTRGAFGVSAVTSVMVKKVVMKLSNADNKNNLSNFESVRMTIYSDNDTASANIAVINFPQAYSDSLVYTPNPGTEISNYLKGSELGYNLFWKNRRTTDKFLKLILSVTLSVQ